LETAIFGVISILSLGISAQWLAWRFRIPSILFLLLFGFLAGPVTGLLHPELLLGDFLFPFISISVAIILFEGGLTLKLSEFKTVGGTIQSLVIVGVLVTWVLTTLAARFILNLPLSLSLLLGAILVVTGPTVIVPLLRHLRLRGDLSPILKWEAMLNDPIGVILAVLVYEAILAGGSGQAAGAVVIQFFKVLLIGCFFGVASGMTLAVLIRRYLIPDYLQSVSTLAIVVITYGVTNIFQSEAGLFAVTVMGITLANQKKISIRNIIEFKENLRVLLISSLFVILAARLDLQSLMKIDFSTILFFIVLVMVVRPCSVFVSTVRSKLAFREKLFLAWMAPRGIVAAATASIFALSLEVSGVPGASRLLTITFLVVIGTVLFYGVTSPKMAYALKVAHVNPQGVLILGAQDWAQRIALTLKQFKIRVLLVDTNEYRIRQARKKGLLAVTGNILSQDFVSKLNLSGIGYFLGLTSNDEVNSFSALQFSKYLGNDHVYQLAVEKEGTAQEDLTDFLHGRTLFEAPLTYTALNLMLRDESSIKMFQITNEQNYESFQKEYGEKTNTLFVVNDEGHLQIASLGASITAKEGSTLVFV
jgi:NhaP-type Na+/H+ or K+/H+ antiporter